MGTAAPKHFQYSAFCFVTRGAVTKRLRHLQPLIRISRRGEEETGYTGWEICVTRKQFCRNFPWNFTRISAPCPGFCQMMPRFARKYGSSGLAVVSLLSFVDLVGFGVFFAGCTAGRVQQWGQGVSESRCLRAFGFFQKNWFPWMVLHTHWGVLLFLRFPSQLQRDLPSPVSIISPPGEEHNSLSHFRFS